MNRLLIPVRRALLGAAMALLLALVAAAPVIVQAGWLPLAKSSGGGSASYTAGAQVIPQHPGFAGITTLQFTGLNGGVNFPAGSTVEAFIGNDQGAAFTSVLIGGQSATAVSGAADSSGRCQLYQATMPGTSQPDTVDLNFSIGALNYVGVTTGYFQNLVSTTRDAVSVEQYANQSDPQFPASDAVPTPAPITVSSGGFGVAYILTFQATVPTALSWQTTTPSFITASGGDVYSPFTSNTIIAVGSAHTSTSGAGWLPKVSGVTTSMSFVACMSVGAWH